MMSSKTKQYEMDMCSGPILRKMLMFALPLMLSSILQLLFNAADIVVVGKFAGDNSLAAVGSNTALINLLTNLFIGLSIGANVVAARHYGAKAWDDLRRTVHTAMLLSMLSGALLLVLGVIGAEQMLIWMQTPEASLWVPKCRLVTMIRSIMYFMQKKQFLRKFQTHIRHSPRHRSVICWQHFSLPETMYSK